METLSRLLRLPSYHLALSRLDRSKVNSALQWRTFMGTAPHFQEGGGNGSVLTVGGGDKPARLYFIMNPTSNRTLRRYYLDYLLWFEIKKESVSFVK